jgi:flagellar M-ring protein FliF
VDEKLIEYDPERRVPKVQTVTTRVSGGAPFSGGGVPGMQANLNLSQSGIIQSVGSSEEEETAQTQYELSKTERIIANHGASLKRLSVAVLVDGMYEEQKSDDGKVQKVYVPRSKEDLARIAGLVKQAIGIDESGNRNDGFEIQSVQFYEPSYEQEEASIKKEQQREFMLKMAKNGSLAITVLVFLMFIMRSMKKLKKTNKVELQDNQIRTQPTNTNIPLNEDFEEEAEETMHAALREQIIKNIRKDPSLAANSLKKWMATELSVENR